MEAINTVVKAKTYLSFEVFQMLRNKLACNIILTRREKEVLELIANGMTNVEIVQKIFIGTTTADTHRKICRQNLKQKMWL